MDGGKAAPSAAKDGSMRLPARRLALVSTALLGLSVLTACSTDAPPPPPVAVVPPFQAITKLSPAIVDRASAYQAYVQRTAALTPGYTSGDQIQAALRTSNQYEPRTLAEGAVAYAAIVALQEPSFVAGVKSFAHDAASRDALVARILSDPYYASQFPGAAAAADLIVSTLTADGEAIVRAGAAIKQSAYDIQKERWSREFVADRDGRLALAKSDSSVPAAPSPELSANLMRASMAGSGLMVSRAGRSAATTQTVVRGLAIAALASLGAAGDENAAQVSGLLDEGVGPSCMNLAKLNLYQCLAVAKPHYEDVFCLGQHALMETGRCVQKTVGTAPVEERVVDRIIAARDAASGGSNAAQVIGTPYGDLNKKPTPAKRKSRRK